MGNDHNKKSKSKAVGEAHYTPSKNPEPSRKVPVLKKSGDNKREEGKNIAQGPMKKESKQIKSVNKPAPQIRQEAQKSMEKNQNDLPPLTVVKKKSYENPKVVIDHIKSTYKLEDHVEKQLQKNKFNMPGKMVKGQFVLDESRILFFKCGGNTIYCSDIYAFHGAKNEKTLWTSLDGDDYVVERAFAIPQEVAPLFEIEHILACVGQFVIWQNKWGFVLNLSSLSDAYEGKMNDIWAHLLRFKFFQEKFSRYAYFMLDKDEIEMKVKEIPSSLDDKPIEPEFVPFYDRLFIHQKQEVGWMLKREIKRTVNTPVDLDAIPFLDTGFWFRPSDPSKLLKKHELLYDRILMPGGILASDVGAGKTVTIIGLLSIGSDFEFFQKQIPNKSNDQKEIEDEEMKMDEIEKEDKNIIWRDFYKRKEELISNLQKHFKESFMPSLVIVTKNILFQWAEEINNFCPQLKFLIVENASDLINIREPKLTAKGPEWHFILTHREVLENDLKGCSLFTIGFQRIVIDEIHEITMLMTKNNSKNLKSHEIALSLDSQKFLKNLSQISRKFTWGLTGTPNNLNYLEDASALLRLLGYEPKYYKMNVFSKISNLFVKKMMRKNYRLDKLPGLKKNIENILFSQLENILYRGKMQNAIHDENTVREMCTHMLPQFQHIDLLPKDGFERAIELVSDKMASVINEIEIKLSNDPDNKNLQARFNNLIGENNFYLELISLLKSEMFSCSVCLEDKDKNELVVTKCFHVICVTCFTELCKNFLNICCPFCKFNISEKEVIVHPRLKSVKNESKLQKILDYLLKVPLDEKIIIFSQFHNLVDKLCTMFQSIDVKYVVLKGAPSDINISLNKFKTMKEVRILLMSIEQSASGLNIQEANHIIFAHPIFGMSQEKSKIVYNQCIGRAFRTGQSRVVNVKMYVTINSIEEDYAPAFLK